MILVGDLSFSDSYLISHFNGKHMIAFVYRLYTLLNFQKNM